MKDEKFYEAMSDYKAALGNCNRKPEVKSAFQGKRLLLLTTATAALVVGFLAFSPKSAVARTTSDVDRAISNAQTMEVVSSIETSPGRWHTFNHIFYKNGFWRHRIIKGTGLALSITVRDGFVLREYELLGHAVLERQDPGRRVNTGWISALDFVKMNVAQGGDEEWSSSTQPAASVDGREAYKVILEKDAGSYHAEILVDKKTDLPISSTTVLSTSGGNHRRYKEQYRFNHPLADSLFALSSTKPVLRLEAEQEKLKKAWSDSIARSEETTVRDASVTGDGTLWLACTMPSTPGLRNLPTEVLGENNQRYLRTLDILPSSILENAGSFKVDDQTVVVVGFVPLRSGLPRSESFNVRFARRRPNYPGHSPHPDKTEERAETLAISFRTEDGKDRPSYFSALDLDYFGFHLPILNWGSKAAELQKEGFLLEAARAYDETAKAQMSFVKFKAAEPLRKAAACYRKLGQPKIAERREAEAAALEASKER